MRKFPSRFIVKTIALFTIFAFLLNSFNINIFMFPVFSFLFTVAAFEKKIFTRILIIVLSLLIFIQVGSTLPFIFLLKSFEKRKAILGPYRGDKIKNGQLENCLLSKETCIELAGLNIKIEETSKELIERWCELETMSNAVKEKELTEKYHKATQPSKE